MNTMLANWKSIAVFLDDTPQSEKIGDYAAGLALRCGARLIGIHGIQGFPGSFPEDSFVHGKQAIDALIDRQQAAEGKRAFAVARRFVTVARKQDISTEFRVIWSGSADEAALNSLHCDLVILGHPLPRGLPEAWTADRLLIATGVPVLAIPDGWDCGTIGTKVIVGWNGSREARRAITDAMPLLSTAQSVTVLVVDSAKIPQKYGAEPGADISLYLARHGVQVELQQATASGASIAGTILSKATEQNADLIVIGAYSHRRTSEVFFGGVTRDLLADVSMPILLSR